MCFPGRLMILGTSEGPNPPAIEIRLVSIQIMFALHSRERHTGLGTVGNRSSSRWFSTPGGRSRSRGLGTTSQGGEQFLRLYVKSGGILGRGLESRIGGRSRGSLGRCRSGCRSAWLALIHQRRRRRVLDILLIRNRFNSCLVCGVFLMLFFQHSGQGLVPIDVGSFSSHDEGNTRSNQTDQFREDSIGSDRRPKIPV